MTGYRLGYAIVPRGSVRAIQVMQQNLFISTNCFVQHAGLAVLRDRSDVLEEMLAAYTRRRRLLIDGLRELGFRIPVEPKGAFYVFADARAFDSDSLRLALRATRSRKGRHGTRGRFRRIGRGLVAFRVREI